MDPISLPLDQAKLKKSTSHADGAGPKLMPPVTTAPAIKEMGIIPIHAEMQKLVQEVIRKADNYSLYRATYIDQLRKLVMPINGRRLTRHECAATFCNFFATLEWLCYRYDKSHEDISSNVNPRAVLGASIYDWLPQEGKDRLNNMFQALLSELGTMQGRGYRLCEGLWTRRDAIELEDGMSAEFAAIIHKVRSCLEAHKQFTESPPVAVGEAQSTGNSSVAHLETLLDTLFDQLKDAGFVFTSTIYKVEGGYEFYSPSKDPSTASPSTAEALETALWKHDWIVDTGADRHVCPNRSSFTNYKALHPPETLHGAGTCLAMGTGDVTLVILHNSVRRHIVLRDVYHVPSMAFNMLSVSKFNRAFNCRFSAVTGYCELINKDTQEVVVTGSERNSLWWLDVATGWSSLMH